MPQYRRHAACVVATVFVLFISALVLVEAGVPQQRYENLMKQQSSPASMEHILYNASDHVLVLHKSNFKSSVVQQNHTSLVEFYNSFCGHCKRFAPTYKQLAKNLLPWRDILNVYAIDCADEENNGICREYEVMSYPSLRYYGLGFKPGPKKYGKQLESQDLSVISARLAQWIVAENHTDENWPNFQPLTEKEAENLFEAPDTNTKQYVVVVYEPEGSTAGIQSILNLQRYPTVQVRRVADNDTAAKFQLDAAAGGHKIAIVSRSHQITPYTVKKETIKVYHETIVNALHSLDVTERPFTTQKSIAVSTLKFDGEQNEENDRVLAEVKANKHLVYQADLEMALRSTLFNEIPKIANISGERLLALQRYLAVVQRYNPLGNNGHTFVSKLYEFVMQHNQQLGGKEFEDEVNRLKEKYQPLFTANRFIGCTGSKPNFRGFTCSLWQLFHFITVQASNNEQSQDPLEVVQAMHGYIKYFFGCTDCSEHFQAMAARRKIWSIPNKDEAILWLWAAHNEVNQRLSGDETEDPRFPKIQFPSQSSCVQCYKRPITTSANLDISWDKDAVLSFLKNIHNPEYVSRFGLEDDSQLHPMLQKLRQKRMVGNVFSDMDMRMGMLLYGFCIIMMVVAFKLFAFKGYRKKPYGHDLLGKV